jgi:probable rRNA maturation factor
LTRVGEAVETDVRRLLASSEGELPIDVEIVGHALPPAVCERAARASLVASGVEDGHLSITFVDADRIRELNAAHRGVERPTDVLSFPIDGRGLVPGPRELGDVIICAEHTADLEKAIVHGVLHLCGHDHEMDGGEMLALQSEVLRALRA